MCKCVQMHGSASKPALTKAHMQQDDGMGRTAKLVDLAMQVWMRAYTKSNDTWTSGLLPTRMLLLQLAQFC